MRIVSRKEFLAIKDIVVYSDIDQYGNIQGLNIKEDTWGNDFVYSDILSWVQKKDSKGFNSNKEVYDIIREAYSDSTYEFELDLHCTSREGLYDDDMKYVIYDRSDLLKLINRLQAVYIENCTEIL